MESSLSLLEHFKSFPDPRKDRTKKHKLMDILGIVIAASICGAEGWDEIVIFAKAKKTWLENFLELKNGIPSADTIRRLIERIDPKKFELNFANWSRNLFKNTEGKIVSIDGKSVRKSNPLCLVSAWCNANKGICLGQVATEAKSNEIKAIPELLSLLEIKGALVTIDAAGCQREIAKQIVLECQANYVLAVKRNQPELFQTIDEFFTEYVSDFGVPVKKLSTYDDKRGREEIRKYSVCCEVEWMPCKSKWYGLKSIGMVESKGIRKGKEYNEKRYFIMSKTMSAKEFEKTVRGHWNVENKLHWMLDVVYNEDKTPIKSSDSNRILSLVKKISINTFKQQQNKGESIKQMRKRCGWDHTFLETMLQFQGI